MVFNDDGSISISSESGQEAVGIEMTSVRHIKFNPFNTSLGFASVADINMLRTLDGGDSFEISNDGFISINTVYDYAFVSANVIIRVGGR